MLTNLTLRNFQTHRKLTLDFDPHVTTIVGPTDSGKSSILRAIRWLVMNRPSGDAFVRHGRKFASVSVTVDGTEIERRKGTKENSYRIGGKTLKAFKQDVPPEVAAKLNMGSLNFQQQHDSPFWLMESAGQVSRNLNEIINLGSMDEAMSKASAAVRQAKSHAVFCQERLTKAREQKRQLRFAKRIDKDLRKVEGLNTKIEGIDNSLRFLSEVVQQVKHLTRTIEIAGQARTEWRELESRHGKLVAVQEQVEILEVVLQNARNANHATTAKGMDTKVPDRKLKRLLSVEAKAQTLQTLLEETKQWRQHALQTRRSMRKLENQLQQKLKGRCPLCGGRMPPTSSP